MDMQMIRAIDIRRPDTDSRLGHDEFYQLITMLKDKRAQTPILFLSRSKIRNNLLDLSAALPDVGIRYAVKANNHPVILEEVAAAGFSFDIASCREALSAIEAGGTVKQFIHSHPIKSNKEIEDSIRAGINLFVVDNPDEIDKFAAYAGKVRLLIRFRIDDSSAVIDLSYKFGCTLEDIDLLAKNIRDLGLEYYGLTFHVGSQCLDSSIYVRAVKSASIIIKRLAIDNFNTRLLDIGGGFPVPYTDKIPSIDKFCEPIRKSLIQNIDPNIIIICEPGRFISATAVTLAASVIGKSKRRGRPWYFMDDGLYGSFSGRLYDHCKYQVLTSRNTTWRRSVLAGPTCDSFDIIYEDAILPPLEVGDIVLFPVMGAYCSVSSSDFNCLKKAEYIIID